VEVSRHHASISKCVEYAQLFGKGENALIRAARRGSLEHVKLLLRARANIDTTTEVASVTWQLSILHMSADVCLSVHMCLCVFIYTEICMYLYAYIHTYAHTCTHTYLDIHSDTNKSGNKPRMCDNSQSFTHALSGAVPQTFKKVKICYSG
jgi:hypothetical protein